MFYWMITTLGQLRILFWLSLVRYVVLSKKVTPLSILNSHFNYGMTHCLHLKALKKKVNIKSFFLTRKKVTEVFCWV